MAKYTPYEVGDSFSVSVQDNSDSALFVGTTYSDILKIKDELGYSNLERVYYSNMYGDIEKLKADFERNIIKIDSEEQLDWTHAPRVGTIILIEPSTLNRAVAARDGGAKQMAKDPNYKNINDSGAFISDEIEAIITSSGYTKAIIGKHGEGSYHVRKEMPGARVIMWCRALKESGGENGISDKIQKKGSSQNIDSHGLKGKWIDVTKYVTHIETNLDDNGGNFSITLPPVQGIYSQEMQSWEVDPTTLIEYPNNIVGTSAMYGKDSLGRPQRTEFFFKNAISNNDLVFIAFEPLEDEKEERLNSKKGDNILRSEFITPKGGNWDMIGLVDQVGESSEYGSNEVNISVQGRDLSKLIIDDGSYMFPLLFDEHNFINKESNLYKRNLFNGSFNFYAEPRHRSVKEAVDWIINVVSNIRVIPEKVAEQAAPEGSEGLKEVQIKKENGLENTRTARLSEGYIMLERIIDTYNPTFFDTDLFELRLPDIQSIWNAVRPSFEKVINNTTDGEQIAIKYSDYQPALTRHTLAPLPASSTEVVDIHRGNRVGAIADGNGTIMEFAKAMFDVIMIERNKQEPREVVASVGGGIWRWVKLLYDKNIMNRKLADVSLGRPDGSLINLIWNYAQSPWIEFFMDTWGDSFHFMFRRPPWNKVLIQEYFRKGWIGNVIVEGVDVISDNINFDTEAYSTFQIDYRSATWGTNDLLASVIPTIPFSELAEVWGNKRLRVSTNMIPLNDTEDASSILNRTTVRDKGIDDLMFVVDTYIYKPFTRRGTFTLNGDRRLKKGTWFLYKPTNEIFYITSVKQTYDSSLDRTTTIQVERGMVLDYVMGDKTIDDNGKQVELTYFNLIDSEVIANTMKDQLSNQDDTDTETLLRNESRRPVENSLMTGKVKPSQSKESIFKLNRSVFNFFLQKRQFGRDKVKL